MPVVDLVGQANWNNYKALMRNAQETFAKKIILWQQSLGGIDRFSEDNPTERFNYIVLQVLLQFNTDVRRSRPITVNTEQGEEDRETVLLIINKQYLDEYGYLDPDHKLFIFNPAADRFIVDGILYKCQGWTDTSQDNEEALWVTITLERDLKATGKITIDPNTLIYPVGVNQIPAGALSPNATLSDVINYLNAHP